MLGWGLWVETYTLLLLPFGGGSGGALGGGSGGALGGHIAGVDSLHIVDGHLPSECGAHVWRRHTHRTSETVGAGMPRALATSRASRHRKGAHTPRTPIRPRGRATKKPGIAGGAGPPGVSTTLTPFKEVARRRVRACARARAEGRAPAWADAHLDARVLHRVFVRSLRLGVERFDLCVGTQTLLNGAARDAATGRRVAARRCAVASAPARILFERERQWDMASTVRVEEQRFADTECLGATPPVPRWRSP